MTPAARPEDATRAVALGTEARTVIAGLSLVHRLGTRHDDQPRRADARRPAARAKPRCILRTFASYVRDGLIPNMFPDGERAGAVSHGRRDALVLPRRRPLRRRSTGDRDTLRILLPVLRDIIEHHVRGTRFGIGVDPGDGLLRQGEDGYQLTWMDAKVGDWVVTPRRGKAVEINALFYNALRLLEGWIRGRRRRRARADR